MLEAHREACEPVLRDPVEPRAAHPEHRGRSGPQRQDVGLRVEPIGDVGIQRAQLAQHAEHGGPAACLGRNDLAAGSEHVVAEVVATADLDHGDAVATLDQPRRHERHLPLGPAVAERVEDERGVHGLDTRVPPMADTGTTTVVVITRDRPDRLRSCIERLRHQDAAEVLVVDDGSEDEAAVAAAARSGGARLVRQGRMGMATARNTGTAHARGSYLLFTDDDCEPVPGWAASLSARLAAGADVVAGPTRAARPERALDTAWQLIADELVEWHGAGRGFLPGSNFGARADALASLPFDARFDGVGAEDRDWWARVHRAQMTVAYVPDAAVDHAPDLGLARFARKQVTYGRGAYRYRAAHHNGRIGSMSFYGRLIGAAARSGPRVTALVTLAQVAAAAGFASEGLRERRGRRASPSPAPRRLGH